jgi:hypothetical protein
VRSDGGGAMVIGHKVFDRGRGGSHRHCRAIELVVASRGDRVAADLVPSDLGLTEVEACAGRVVLDQAFALSVVDEVSGAARPVHRLELTLRIPGERVGVARLGPRLQVACGVIRVGVGCSAGRAACGYPCDGVWAGGGAARVCVGVRRIAGRRVIGLLYPVARLALVVRLLSGYVYSAHQRQLIQFTHTNICMG